MKEEGKCERRLRFSAYWPVLKALRANNLDIVAIHHHMLETQPTIIFLHYWGTGPAEKLATGFKAALDQLGKTKAVSR